MSAPPVLAAKLSCVLCVSWLIFGSPIFAHFAKRLAIFALKTPTIFEDEDRFAEDEDD